MSCRLKFSFNFSIARITLTKAYLELIFGRRLTFGSLQYLCGYLGERCTHADISSRDLKRQRHKSKSYCNRRGGREESGRFHARLDKPYNAFSLTLIRIQVHQTVIISPIVSYRNLRVSLKRFNNQTGINRSFVKEVTTTRGIGLPQRRKCTESRYDELKYLQQVQWNPTLRPPR